MTWGSHCPMCGLEDCSWTRDGTCEGRQRLAAQSAADECGALRTEIERLRKEVSALRDKSSEWFRCAKAAEAEERRPRPS